MLAAAFVLQLWPMAAVAYKLGSVAFASAVLLTHRALLVCELAATGALSVNAAVAMQWRYCIEIYLVTRAVALFIASGTLIASAS